MSILSCRTNAMPIDLSNADFQNCVSGIVLDFMVGGLSANGTSVLMNLHLMVVILYYFCHLL
jgi:hypothetical protein